MSSGISLGRRRLLSVGASAVLVSSAAEAAQPEDSLHILTTGLLFPEGPVALDDGSVLCVEIARGTLTRIHPDGTKAVVAKLGGGPNGAAIGPDGACYVANDGGLTWHTQNGTTLPTGVPADFAGGSIQRVDLRTGAARTLYTHAGENQLKGPNDLVFEPSGGFFFTDTGKFYARTQDRGGVYWAKPDGSEIRQVVYPLVTPNGIMLSPDRQTLYVASTATRQIWSFRITGPGQLAQKDGRAEMKVVASLGGIFNFDSMCMQADGTLVAAAGFPGQLMQISPNGNVLNKISLPDAAVTNAAFGGHDMRTLYVTFSATGRIAVLPWPSPGLKLLYR
jgi:gluconolactonase